MRPIALPKDIFVDTAIVLRDTINQFFGFLLEVAVGRDLKTFLAVILYLIFFPSDFTKMVKLLSFHDSLRSRDYLTGFSRVMVSCYNWQLVQFLNYIVLG